MYLYKNKFETLCDTLQIFLSIGRRKAAVCPNGMKNSGEEEFSMTLFKKCKKTRRFVANGVFL